MRPVPQDRYSVGWTVSDQDEWRSGECTLYLRTGTVSGGQSVTRTNSVGWTVSDQDEWRSGECDLYLRTGTVSGGQSVIRKNGVQVNVTFHRQNNFHKIQRKNFEFDISFI